MMPGTAIGMVLVIGAAGLAACNRDGAQEVEQRERVVSVRTAAVVEEEIARPIVATGTLGPKDEIALAFKVGGVIGSVDAAVGQIVRAGDTLARLDPREIDAAVARARSAADKAERDVARARRLYADSVVTRAQMEDAETAAEVARADLDAARFNQRYATIVAPAGGVILHRRAEAGQVVAAGGTVLVLGSRSRGSVLRAGLADRDIVRIRRGDAAFVRFDALPGRTFQGSVSEIAAAAEPGTGTYGVEIALPTAIELAAGMVGAVEILPGAAMLAAVVPIEAVQEADGSHAIVFSLSADGERAERRAVTVDFIAGDRVAIRSGLDGAREVLTAGAAYLNDGAAVRVIR